MNFDQAFDMLLDPDHEGGYSNNSADPGGETMYGITARVARRNNYTGPMKDLPRDLAKRIARKEYWEAAHVDELPQEIRFDVFDTAYNSGPAQAIRFVQRAADIPADGAFGPTTRAAVYVPNPYQLLCRFNGQRLDFLNNLPTWPTFGKGWAQRIATNLMRA